MGRGVIVTAILICLVGTASAQPARVGLLYNPTYVNVGPTIGDEATNLLLSLESLGYSVTTLVSGSGTIANFLLFSATHQAFAIPTLASPLSPALTPDFEAAARTYVGQGGTLLTFAPNSGGPLAVLNSVFSFNLTAAPTTIGPVNKTAAAAGTPFAGTAGSLPINANATDAVLSSSLPPGATMIYADAAGNSVVTLIRVGEGYIVILGWDWFDAAPRGSQDGGWNAVLDVAASLTSVTTAVPTLSEWAFIGMIVLLVVTGLARLRRARPFS